MVATATTAAAAAAADQKRGTYTVTAVSETTPLYLPDEDDDDYGGEEYFSTLKGESVRRESIMADHLSMRLLAIADDDSAAEDAILQETLDIPVNDSKSARSLGSTSYRSDTRPGKQAAYQRLCGMIGLAFLGLVILVAALIVGVQFIGPPNQPVGPYQLVERQVGCRCS